MVITDGGCARVERAGVGTDHPLAQVGILQPLILEVMLDELCHRPIEQHPASLLILAQASVQLFRGGSVANPKVTIAGGPQSIPQTPNHCRHGHPAIHIARSEAPNLSLARVVVIPQLNTAAIKKRHKEAIRSRRPMKPSFHQSQLIHHQRVQQPCKISARRHPHPWERLLDGTGAPHTCPALQHQDAFACPGQVGRAGEAIMAGADDDGVPRLRSQLRDRRREADLAQY